MKGLFTIAFLILSNVFMTFAWYGQLKLKEYSWFQNLSIFQIILFGWSIAFSEYCFMTPANKVGFIGNGGPFTLLQLKVIQEVITLSVFVCFSLMFFKNEVLKWNHLAGFGCLILAVYFIFKK